MGHVREGLVMNWVGVFDLLSEVSVRGRLTPGFWLRISGIEKLARARIVGTWDRGW